VAVGCGEVNPAALSKSSRSTGARRTGREPEPAQAVVGSTRPRTTERADARPGKIPDGGQYDPACDADAEAGGAAGLSGWGPGDVLRPGTAPERRAAWELRIWDNPFGTPRAASGPPPPPPSLPAVAARGDAVLAAGAPEAPSASGPRSAGHCHRRLAVPPTSTLPDAVRDLSAAALASAGSSLGAAASSGGEPGEPLRRRLGLDLVRLQAAAAAAASAAAAAAAAAAQTGRRGRRGLPWRFRPAVVSLREEDSAGACSTARTLEESSRLREANTRRGWRGNGLAVRGRLPPPAAAAAAQGA
jgi:hypothetical protein